MGHRIGAHLTGNLHQSACDQGPRQGSAEGITALIQGVGPDRWKRKFGDEWFDQITNQRLAGAGIQCLLANRFKLIPLTQVGSKGDHLLHAPLVFEIRNADAGIHSAGVSQHHLVCPRHESGRRLIHRIVRCRAPSNPNAHPQRRQKHQTQQQWQPWRRQLQMGTTPTQQGCTDQGTAPCQQQLHGLGVHRLS